MPSAASTTTGTSRSRGARRRRPPPARVRWDRIARLMMLFVLLVLLYLYISPARSFLSTLSEAKHQRAEVARLERENAALRRRRRELRQPGTLEREARRLGMVRPGERPYVVTGLPAN